MLGAEPSALRADFKDQYRSVVAAAYAATGNLPRAQARLAVLGDVNQIDALNAQAQRMHASSQAFERADHLAALASALDRETSDEITSGAPASTPTLQVAIDAGETFTPTSPAPLTEDATFFSETTQPVESGTTVVETQP